MPSLYSIQSETTKDNTVGKFRKLINIDEFNVVVSKEAIEENPTQYLLDVLQESEEDYKAGRYKTFTTGQDALDYLDAEIINGKKDK